jgi:tRNA (guanine37-N1)-methyltransferase
MRFDIVTIFPEFFAGPLDYGIVRRARESNLIQIHVQDLREFTHDRHRTVDDRPFGGGEGMVLKPEPLFEAVESLVGPREMPAEQSKTAIVLLSASGKLFRQADARRLAGLDRVVLLCGRYEGVDERVAQHLATDELSIGDFVLSGGELAAALILDAVTRLLPGALGNEASSVFESFSVGGSSGSPAETVEPKGDSGGGHIARFIDATRPGGLLLDFPHYTRPAEFRGWPVPDVLLNGNHEHIRRWRRQAAIEKTRRNRPDLIGDAS